MEYVVVLVEPKFEGNIGAIARGMKNFGLSELRLVRPVPLIDEAYRRAKHARTLLDHAKRYTSLDAAVSDLDLVVATSGVAGGRSKKPLRVALEPVELSERLAQYSGRVAIVFGAEDTGLTNDLVAQCDLLVSIPTAPSYPILNLSHAATVIFYELYRERKRGGRRVERAARGAPFATRADDDEEATIDTLQSPVSVAGPPKLPKLASREERAIFLDRIDRIQRATDTPAPHRERIGIIIRRILGRAGLTKWEYHRLMGVLSRTLKWRTRGGPENVDRTGDETDGDDATP